MYDGGIFHAFYLVVDAKERRTGDDFFQVNILFGSADERKVFRVFKCNFLWYGQGSSQGGQFSVACFLSASFVLQEPRGGGEFSSRHLPGLRSSID